jgi:hypothetical protein
LPHNGSHSVDDTLNIRFRHPGVDRQRNDPFKSGAGSREVLWAIAKCLAVIGLQMQRNKMDTGADVVLLEQVNELAPVRAES